MSTGKEKPTVLIVDDMPDNIEVLVNILRNHYNIKVATSGMDALKIVVAAQVPDLILLDVMMPEIDGFEVCRILKQNVNTQRIPVIFVTAKGEVDDESEGFEVGGVDYITKPVCAPIVLARIKTHLVLYDSTRHLEHLVQERTIELKETRIAIIKRLGRAAEYKDDETGTHIIRMSHYCHRLALALSLSEEEADLILSAAPMHDIGKIGISDDILLKPGKLNAEEMAAMRQHCVIGAEIIGEHQSLLLQTAHTIALHHHERWNGTGYPHGLKGEAIPLYCRIAALADVFDALTSERPYKKAWPIEDAFNYIQEESGAFFDPQLVPYFISLEPGINEIRSQYSD